MKRLTKREDFVPGKIYCRSPKQHPKQRRIFRFIGWRNKDYADIYDFATGNDEMGILIYNNYFPYNNIENEFNTWLARR